MTRTLLDSVRLLPLEIRIKILEFVYSPSMTQPVPFRGCLRDPSIPPEDGSCPLLKLPFEVRRLILHEFLPAKHAVIYPYSNGSRRNPTSRTCDLLILNKKLCNELSLVLYEERVFAINVYEGISSASVEFLNSGRQRLQYRHAFTDVSFRRFEGGDTPFGFQRLRRILFIIHPSKDKLSKTNRHDPMLTCFMIHAMINILHENGPVGLEYLKIQFAEDPDAATDTARGAHYWWNPDLQVPRETSVHGISNVELILRAFLRLEKVHKLEVALPESMNNHKGLQSFVSHLTATLDPRSNVVHTFDYDLEHKLEVAREALDEWIFLAKFGNSSSQERDVWIGLGELPLENLDWLTEADLTNMDEDDQINLAIRRSLNQHMPYNEAPGTSPFGVSDVVGRFKDEKGNQTSLVTRQKALPHTQAFSQTTPSSSTKDAVSAGRAHHEPQSSQKTCNRGLPTSFSSHPASSDRSHPLLDQSEAEPLGIAESSPGSSTASANASDAAKRGDDYEIKPIEDSCLDQDTADVSVPRASKQAIGFSVPREDDDEMDNWA